eukprot:SAG31_NODE_2_length_46263_cov_45.908043_23_plen_125_part_00
MADHSPAEAAPLYLRPSTDGGKPALNAEALNFGTDGPNSAAQSPSGSAVEDILWSDAAAAGKVSEQNPVALPDGSDEAATTGYGRAVSLADGQMGFARPSGIVPASTKAGARRNGKIACSCVMR